MTKEQEMTRAANEILLERDMIKVGEVRHDCLRVDPRRFNFCLSDNEASIQRTIQFKNVGSGAVTLGLEVVVPEIGKTLSDIFVNPPVSGIFDVYPGVPVTLEFKKPVGIQRRPNGSECSHTDDDYQYVIKLEMAHCPLRPCGDAFHTDLHIEC